MSEVDALLAEAGEAARAGRNAEAVEVLRRALAVQPDNRRVLNALGNRLLAAGEPEQARAQFRKVVESDPKAAPVWLNLSITERLLGNEEGEFEALQGALTADPYFGMALLHKAQHLERRGDKAGASETYSALLACAPPEAQLPPAFRQAMAHARAFLLGYREEQVSRLRSAAASTGIVAPRIERAIDLFAGLAQPPAPKVPFPPKPIGFYVPDLPPDGYFDEALFPWFARLEAATDSIRSELLGVLERDTGLRPYVEFAPHQPANQWAELNHSLTWSAFFLWENGERNDANADSCPATDALLRELPLLDIPGMAPTAMFSIMKPGAHIPPHHGVTNTRAVIHLPLIVPEGCAFRVGGETREWREGVAWGFDDTVEHEAWNRSSQVRAILIVDAWNPHLDEEERAVLRAAMPVLGGRLSD